MSTQFAINKQALENMQKFAAHNLLGNYLVKISLQKAEIAGKKLVGNGKLATKENHAESLENLNPDSLLEFTFEIIAPKVFTSFSHKLLAEQNTMAQEMSDKFKVYANHEVIEMERDNFMGETIDSAIVHNLIKQFVKNSKEANKIAKRWRKVKGSYEVKQNGEFIPYAAQEKPIESPKQEESENLHYMFPMTKEAHEAFQALEGKVKAKNVGMHKTPRKPRNKNKA